MNDSSGILLIFAFAKDPRPQSRSPNASCTNFTVSAFSSVVVDGNFQNIAISQ